MRKSSSIEDHFCQIQDRFYHSTPFAVPEYKEILNENPFSKLDIRFREAKLLPKTISFHSIQAFLSTLYAQKEQAESEYQQKCCIRDIAVIELLKFMLNK